MMETVGVKLLDWGIGKVADVVFEQTSTQLKVRLDKSDLVEAITLGVSAAERSLPETDGLFHYCDDRDRRRFKQAVFSNSDVQGELQRPFHDEGKPRVEFLMAGFRQVAQDTAVKLNERALKPWLEKFCDAYCEKTLALRFRIARQDYCEQLVNWYDDVKFAGIAVEGQVIEEAKELENIFVMPDAVAEKRGNWASALSQSEFPFAQPVHEILESFYGEYESRGRARQLALLAEQQQWVRESESQWSGAKVLASQLLQQHHSKKLVLLGAPGSGKTTLMSYFAVMVAKGELEPVGLARASSNSASLPPSSESLAIDPHSDILPILIRIRDLTANPTQGILEFAKQFAENTLSCMPLPGGFFEAWLNHGRALILLDGLDEIAEEGRRQEMVRKIENFLGQYDQNRAIVTSRPAGYRRDFFRTSEYPHYLLQPFDDDKIEQFITNWYDSRTPDPAESARRKDSLRKALADNDRIKLLARNPLLITIIALIHRYQARLPRERYKLYDKAVETLLTTWDSNREITNHQVLQHLRLDDLRRIMERLAYWIHTQGGTDDTEGGTLIDKEDLITQLSQYIREQKKLERHEAKAEAERFLRHIRERTGLLNEQGQDRYAFVHKTFQEYLAAQEIRDQQEESFDVVLEHIRSHLHDSHWREVLLLLIAQQKRGNPTKCLEEILRWPDPYGKWLHRNLFFAGTCLAENIPVTDGTLSAKILDDLVALETQDAQPWVIRKQVFRTLCSLYETEFERLALNRLMSAPVERIGKVRLQEYRAALGDEEGAIATLLLDLSDEDRPVRFSAILALSNLSHISEAVIDGLLAQLKDYNPALRVSAAQALGRDNVSKAATEKLLEWLADESHDIRSKAAEALGNLGNPSKLVIDGLLAQLGDESHDVRSNTVEALGKLGNSSEAVINGLLARLTDEDASVRYRSVLALGNLGNTDKVVIEKLVAQLGDHNYVVRYRASEALGRLGCVSEAVINGLLAVMDDQNSNVRYQSAAALGKLGYASAAVIDSLLVQLDDEDLVVRPYASEALGSLNHTAKAAEKLFIQLKNENADVRSFAVKALGKLGNTSGAVINELLARLNDQDSGVRCRTAEALDKLGHASEAVIGQLLVRLDDEHPGVRSSATEALGHLGDSSEAVIDGLLARLADKDAFVGSRSAQALCQLGRSQAGVPIKLLYWLEQNQTSERVGDAVEALWGVVMAEG